MRRVLNPVCLLRGGLCAVAGQVVERLLVHPGRPDPAGCDADLDGPDAALHACRVGAGPGRLLRPDELGSARNWCDRSRAINTPTRSGGWFRSDWMWPAYGVSMLILALFTIGLWTRVTSVLVARRRDLVRTPSTGGVVRPGPDQRHADAVPGDRTKRTGAVGRSLAGPAARGGGRHARHRASPPTWPSG